MITPYHDVDGCLIVPIYNTRLEFSHCHHNGRWSKTTKKETCLLFSIDRITEGKIYIFCRFLGCWLLLFLVRLMPFHWNILLLFHKMSFSWCYLWIHYKSNFIICRWLMKTNYFFRFCFNLWFRESGTGMQIVHTCLLRHQRAWFWSKQRFLEAVSDVYKEWQRKVSVFDSKMCLSVNILSSVILVMLFDVKWWCWWRMTLTFSSEILVERNINTFLLLDVIGFEVLFFKM